jgi:polysaccharide chain length determinant protein (PEP-CTERM system associated)
MKDLKNLGFNDYLNIIRRRKWYAIITAVLIASAVSVVALKLPSLYKSEMRVLVENQFVSEEFVRPIIRSTPTDRINSIREQISSRTFLERIVEQFQLNKSKDRTDIVMEDAVKALQKQIGIEITSEDTFTLSFTANDPHLARDVTKRLADELIRSNTASRMDKTMATDQFLDEQLQQASQSLAVQEETIKRFKLAHLGELPQQSESNLSTLNGLNSQLASTENALQQAREQQKLLEYRRQERERLNLLAKSVANTEGSLIKPDGAKVPIPSSELELAAQKAALAEMLLKYTPKHPDVENLSRQIQELEQKIEKSKREADSSDNTVEQAAGSKFAGQKESLAAEQEMAAFKFEADSIKNQIEKREKDREEIKQQIKNYQARLKLTPALEQELSTLIREEEAQRQQYQNLQNKKFSSQMAANVETDKKNEAYKIIDEPNLPVRPYFPNRLQIILIGIGVSLLVGLGTSLVREILDSTIGSEDEIESLINLPVLATIFNIESQGKSIRKLLRHKEPVALS